MGAVFRATDTKLGRTVAVKVVSRSRTGDEALRRFRNEAQSAARLDHPNIARVYYVGEDKGWDYIVFEFIDGINVRDLVHQVGALSIPDTISYMLQIAEALAHAARRGVIHRDIKPSNILIMADGGAKLVDMGLARLHQVESHTDELTESGVTLGTFDYISPEQASDPRAADVRSDLYSLGCTMYFMLTGQPPFPDGTMLQKLLKHSSLEAPDPRDIRAELPDELVRIVRRLLAKSPADRYQRPRDLIGELVAVADQLDISGIHPVGPLWTANELRRVRFWERHLPWLVPVTILILAAVGIQLVTWLESSTNTKPSAPEIRAASVPTEPPQKDTAPDRTESPAPTPATDHSGSSRLDAPLVSEPQPDDSNGKIESVGQGNMQDTAQDERTEQTPAERPTAKPADDASGSANELRDATPATPATSDVPTNTAIEPPPDNSNTSPIPEPNDEVSDVAIPVIVVADDDIELPAGWRSAATLSDALQIAAASAQPMEIELRFNGLRQLEPIQIDLRRVPRQELTIRAAVGYSPVLIFRPPVEQDGTPQRLAMMDVFGGHLTCVGVQFHFSLPAMPSPDSKEWSLFDLHDVDRIELRDCTLTVRNRGTGTTLARPRVAFFQFPVLVSDRAPSGTAELVDATPTIWIERCIARGQANLVRANRAVPFLLFWDQGLFVSTERLVEMGGTTIQPRWEHGRATLFFQRLLAVADHGICLTRTDRLAPYSLGLAVNCYDCLFVTQRTSASDVPLYEMQNADPLSEDAVLLSVGGNNNYYKNTQLVLRIRALNSADATQLFTFEDLKKMGEVAWYHENHPQPASMFNWGPRSLPVDEQTLRQFQPAADKDGTLHRILGISPDQLPQPVEIAPSIDLPAPDAAETRFSDRLSAPDDFR